MNRPRNKAVNFIQMKRFLPIGFVKNKVSTTPHAGLAALHEVPESTRSGNDYFDPVSQVVGLTSFRRTPKNAGDPQVCSLAEGRGNFLHGKSNRTQEDVQVK